MGDSDENVGDQNDDLNDEQREMERNSNEGLERYKADCKKRRRTTSSTVGTSFASSLSSLWKIESFNLKHVSKSETRALSQISISDLWLATSETF